MSVSEPSSLRFSAIPIGHAKLPKTQEITRLFQLTADDIPFLQRGLDEFRATKGAMVPVREGIDRANHLELVEEAFDKSIDNLSNKNLKQPPILIAATDDNLSLQGLSLNHLERQLPEGQRVYSPFPDSVNKPHSSVNWLVSLHDKGGIGQQLLAAFKGLLPENVTHIDTLSEIAPFSEQAVALSKKMGFDPLHDLQDAKPVLQTPPVNTINVPSFRDMHGLPMRAKRHNFEHHAELIQKKTNFTPATDKTPVDLNEQGQFPVYAIPTKNTTTS
jgi:hypothetical protein